MSLRIRTQNSESAFKKEKHAFFYLILLIICNILPKNISPQYRETEKKASQPPPPVMGLCVRSTAVTIYKYERMMPCSMHGRKELAGKKMKKPARSLSLSAHHTALAFPPFPTRSIRGRKPWWWSIARERRGGEGGICQMDSERGRRRGRRLERRFRFPSPPPYALYYTTVWPPFRFSVWEERGERTVVVASRVQQRRRRLGLRNPLNSMETAGFRRH